MKSSYEGRNQCQKSRRERGELSAKGTIAQERATTQALKATEKEATAQAKATRAYEGAIAKAAQAA